MISKYKYNILWIDDQWEEMSSYIDICRKNGIELTPCRYAEDGVKLFEEKLFRWDGVILDAKQQMNCDTATNLSGLSYCKAMIDKLEHLRSVPYYVFTGQTDLVDDQTFKDIFGNFYIKTDDHSEAQLLEDIKINADKLPETQMRMKFSDVFKLSSEIDRDLINILPYLEPDQSASIEVFNQMRKVLEWVFLHCSRTGVLLIEFNGTNSNECSRFLASLPDRYVPEAIKRSLHSCVSICNEKSHRGNEENNDVESPYLIRSTIYELLNILHWCLSLPKSSSECFALKNKIENIKVERTETGENDQKSRPLKRDVNSLNNVKNDRYSSKRSVQIQQDADGNFFYEQRILLPYKKCEGRNGAYVIVDEVEPNTDQHTLDRYSLFAKKIMFAEN